MSARLIIMMGYSGSGKTTVAREVSNRFGMYHLVADDLREALFMDPKFTNREHEIVFNAMDYLLGVLLNNGVSVVYDGNINRKKFRDQKRKISDRYKANNLVVWVDTPYNVAKERVQVRDGRVIKEDALRRIKNEFEMPKDSEMFIRINGLEPVSSQLDLLDNFFD